MTVGGEKYLSSSYDPENTKERKKTVYSQQKRHTDTKEINKGLKKIKLPIGELRELRAHGKWIWQVFVF